MRRIVLALSLSIAACASSVAPAVAEGGFALVVPGRMGMTYNGHDAAYAVVEGDFGLNKPGQNPHTIIYPRRYAPGPSEYGYFPNTGNKPRAGRLEIEPPANRKPLPRAESFHQVWSVESQGYADPPPVPQDPPAVIVAPDYDPRVPQRRRP